MIRRFETYAFLPGASDHVRTRLAHVLLDCSRFIPQVLHNAVGWNRSDAPAELVWEHAYASVDDYLRYMEHPYHAEMLDRLILADSPERVVEPVTGAGLFGYFCESAEFALPSGARRVALLQLEQPGPPPDELVKRLAALTSQAGGLFSVVGHNTLANSWFDGVTPLSERPPKWSVVWEQGFADFDTLEKGAATAGVGPPVVRWTDLRYEVASA